MGNVVNSNDYSDVVVNFCGLDIIDMMPADTGAKIEYSNSHSTAITTHAGNVQLQIHKDHLGTGTFSIVDKEGAMLKIRSLIATLNGSLVLIIKSPSGGVGRMITGAIDKVYPVEEKPDQVAVYEISINGGVVDF